MFETFNIERILRVSNKVSKKILVQVEGATCSGKSSFVSDIFEQLKLEKFNILVIEEAATKVLESNKDLMSRLAFYPTKSENWKVAKLELQRGVLIKQMEDLEQFAEDDNYEIALMDRGGASTAYHLAPLIITSACSLVMAICREISKMSSQIIVLLQLGFLREDSFRYQKNLDEIKYELNGIKRYLERWKFHYLEIPDFPRESRSRIGVHHIRNYINTHRIRASVSSKTFRDD